MNTYGITVPLHAKYVLLVFYAEDHYDHHYNTVWCYSEEEMRKKKAEHEARDNQRARCIVEVITL